MCPSNWAKQDTATCRNFSDRLQGIPNCFLTAWCHLIKRWMNPLILTWHCMATCTHRTTCITCIMTFPGPAAAAYSRPLRSIMRGGCTQLCAEVCIKHPQHMVICCERTPLIDSWTRWQQVPGMSLHRLYILCSPCTAVCMKAKMTFTHTTEWFNAVNLPLSVNPIWGFKYCMFAERWWLLLFCLLR